MQGGLGWFRSMNFFILTHRVSKSNVYSWANLNLYLHGFLAEIISLTFSFISKTNFLEVDSKDNHI